MIGRSLALLALLALASQNANAFTTSSFLSQKHFTLSMAADKPDLSIPYDAAARLAYNEWCDTYEKTRDDSRYATFKANYEAISVANIKAKKAAKEAGEEVPTQLTLNEFGDFTAAEYQAMQAGASAPAGGDFLKNAMEAAMSQSEASIALGEAVDALAEEEQLLAEQLGMGSVEEMEAALDAMDGFADDGSELEPDNLSREARVRSAYMGWCKENGKKSDEGRFRVFMSNFLAMEEYANESGRAMILNKYADCTEEEYIAANKGPAPVVSKAAPPTPVVDKAAEAAKAEVAKKAAADAQMAADKAKAEASAAKKAESAKASMSAADEAAANEKERKERQAAQEKAAEKLRMVNEAAAIAAAKEISAKEAAQTAKRQANDAKAAAMLRAQALDAEKKQATLAAASGKRKAPPAPAPPPKKTAFNLFTSKPATTPPATKAAAPAPKAAAPAPKPIPVPVAKTDAPKFDLGSFFKAPEAVKKAPSPKAVVAPKPAPVAAPKPVVASKPAPAAVKAGPFSFFGSPKPAPTPKPAPAPVVAPAKKAEPFSFFGSPKPAPVAAPAPKPVAKQPEPFSFFSIPAPPPAPAKVAPAPTPAPKKPMFSFSFDTKATPPQPAQKKVVQPLPTGPGTVSIKKAQEPAKSIGGFFGGTKAIPQVQKKVIQPTPLGRGTISIKKAEAPTQKSGGFFGGLKGTQQEQKKVIQPTPFGRGTISIKKPEEPAQKSGGFFGGTKVGPQDDIPVLSKFVQNEDGSITGVVSNSKSYRTGTRITTSPVKKGATAGTVVKTSSGSQYRLK